jgi:hypothetical protein
MSLIMVALTAVEHLNIVEDISSSVSQSPVSSKADTLFP